MKVCQPLSGEERSSLNRYVAVFALLLLDDFLYPRRPLVHQVPAADAAVKPWVYLSRIVGYRLRSLGLEQVHHCLAESLFVCTFSSDALTSLIRLSVRLGRPAM